MTGVRPVTAGDRYLPLSGSSTTVKVGWGIVGEGSAPVDLSRRQLLRGLGIGGLAVVALPLGAHAAGATVATTTIWRLNAEWGYPAGPKHWTRCRCSTCHSHAANKVYRTRAAAIAGRLHPCCVCQTESITTTVASAATLFAFVRPGNPDSVDLRWPGVQATFDGIEVIPDPSGDPSTPDAGGSSGDDPPGSGTGAGGVGRSVPNRGSATLPATGTDVGTLTTWGALLAAAGSALWLRTRDPAGNGLEPDRAPDRAPDHH